MGIYLGVTGTVIEGWYISLKGFISFFLMEGPGYVYTVMSDGDGHSGRDIRTEADDAGSVGLEDGLLVPQKDRASDEKRRDRRTG